MARHAAEGESRPDGYTGKHRASEQTADDLRREGGWAVTGREADTPSHPDGWETGGR